MTASTHEFLIDEQNPTDPVRKMVTLREGVESLEETRVRFAPADYLEYHPQWVDDRMFTMLGSWKVPEWASGTSGPIQYANPRYVHVHKLSDYRPPIADLQDPEIKAEYDARCVEWLRTVAHLYTKRSIAAARTGLTSDTSVSRLLQDLDDTYHDWYGEGFRRAATTMTILRGLGVDTELIARAYGITPAGVYTAKNHCDRDEVRSRTPSVLKDQRFNDSVSSTT